LNLTKWLPVENTTTDIIPSFAVAKVTDVVDGIAQIEQCDTDDDPGVIVLAGAVVPSSDSTGRSEGTYDPQVIVAYEESDGVPQPGEIWGPANGSWKLRSGRTGFQILGGAGGGVVNAVRISGAATPAVYDYVDFTSWDITTTNTWESPTSWTITIPDPGQYLLWTMLAAQLEVSTNPAAWIYARLYNDTQTTIVPHAKAPVVTASVVNLSFLGSTTIQTIHQTFASNEVVRIQVARSYKHLAPVPLFTTSKVVKTFNSGSFDPDFGNVLGYVKVG
jgi:hypothetical protein